MDQPGLSVVGLPLLRLFLGLGLVFQVLLPVLPVNPVVGRDRGDHLALHDQLHELVRHVAWRKYLGMLNQIDPRQHRQPQPLDADRVRLGDEPALVGFVDDDFLRLGREADERRIP